MAVTGSEDWTLSRHYGFFSLALYFLPAIFTYVFIALYQMVDGFFIGLYVGDTALAAVNLYYPVISLLLCLGTMLGSGANAAIVSCLGRGDRERACALFSQTVLTALLIGAVLTAVLTLFAEPIMGLLQASPENIGYLRPYYLWLSGASVAIMLQTVIGLLIFGEGKAVLAALLSVVGGVLNCVLDYLFMGVLGLGIAGAGAATVIGYLVPVLYALRHYSPSGGSLYRFTPTRIVPKEMLPLLGNGSSDMLSNLADGVTALALNLLSFRFFAEAGQSVASVRTLTQFFGVAVFMGITTAVEPLLSFRYGQGNAAESRGLLKRSLIWIAILGIACAIPLLVCARDIATLFFDDARFIELCAQSLRSTAPGFLLCGFNIFISGVFTAYSNGRISALLSVTRSLIVLMICMFGMSALFGAAGLWLAWTATELVSLVLSVVMLLRYRRTYGL